MKPEPGALSPSRNRIFKLLCILLAIVAGLGIFEVILRYGKVSDYDKNRATWNPPERFRDLNQQINDKNTKFSRSNRFGFNDRERTEEKPPGIRYRIAVLGDSFIWGDGVPYDVIWSHKLEKKINSIRPDVEVVSWGKCGWSTKDELAFLKENGFRFTPDLLIVGWVTNDPDVGAFKQKDLHLSLLFKPIHIFFPDTANVLCSRTEVMLSNYFIKDYGYSGWQDRLFNPANMVLYNEVLKEFEKFCREKRLPVLFVLTPNNYASFNKDYIDKVIPLLSANRLPFLDLFPAVYKKLSDHPFKELDANPANGHPGDPVTTVFADEVFDYLTRTPRTQWLFARSEGAPVSP